MLITELKKTMPIALPIIVGYLSNIALGITDTIMVGKLGAESLAAVAFASSLFYIPMVFGFGMGTGFSPIVAYANGEKNPTMASKIFKNGFWIHAITGILIAASLLVISQYLHLFGQASNVALLAQKYLWLVSFSAIFTMIYTVFNQFIQGFEYMRPALIIGLSSIPCNIFFNWIFINGQLGCPKLGLEGAAWGTLITRFLMMTAMVGYVYGSKNFGTMALFRLFEFKSFVDKTLAKRILKSGVPSGLQYVFESSAFSISAIMIGTIGSNELAAHQIAINVATITFMVTIGLAGASAIRIGNARGQKDTHQIKAIGQSTLLASIGFIVVCAAAMMLFDRQIAELFIRDEQVVKITITLLWLAALFQLSDAIQGISAGLLRGLEDVKVPTAYILVAYWLMALPMGYVLAFEFEMGVVGVWLGLTIGLTAAAVLLTHRFFKMANLKNL